MSTTENITTCANCGKGEEAGINLKACTACKLVKYCNRDCQIAHRTQHKKACKIRAKEIHDEKLFKQPPPLEDCPICFVRLPEMITGRTYMVCCGKNICNGCCHGYQSRATKEEHDVCPFCRTPPPFRDRLKRYNKRSEMNDPIAICNLACYYKLGHYGLQQDHAKALELWQRAGELGSADAYSSIGNVYHTGDSVAVDIKKAIHYWELAAMKGQVDARHNLGVDAREKGNIDRALKHFMIAVKDGSSYSLKSIKRMYENGDATKDVYNEALQCYQVYLGEIKSDQRDEAAAAFVDGDGKYY